MPACRCRCWHWSWWRPQLAARRRPRRRRGDRHPHAAPPVPHVHLLHVRRQPSRRAPATPRRPWSSTVPPARRGAPTDCPRPIGARANPFPRSDREIAAPYAHFAVRTVSRRAGARVSGGDRSIRRAGGARLCVAAHRRRRDRRSHRCNGAARRRSWTACRASCRPTPAPSLRTAGCSPTLGPEYRAYASVGRTFQDARLYPELSVRETMLVALEKEERPTFTSALLRAPWQVASERRAEARADEALAYFRAHRLRIDANRRSPDRCPPHMRARHRRVATAAAHPARRAHRRDPPSGGRPVRRPHPPAARGARLRDPAYRARHGLVMGLCNRIYAMEAGRVIAEGKPRDVARDPPSSAPTSARTPHHRALFDSDRAASA